MRYVVNPHDGKVLDMRHMLIVIFYCAAMFLCFIDLINLLITEKLCPLPVPLGKVPIACQHFPSFSPNKY